LWKGGTAVSNLSKRLLDHLLEIVFAGVDDGKFALDRSFSLAPANGIPQTTNLTGAGGVLVFTNTPDATTNNFWRFCSVP
jgi:hypothetical protein